MAGVTAFDYGSAALTSRKKSWEARLNHVEGFVNGDLRATPYYRAGLRHLGRGIERRCFDDAVTGRSLADRALRGGPIWLDLVHCAGEGIARVDDCGPELAEPRRPLFHHERLRRRTLGHGAAVIDQPILHAPSLSIARPLSEHH